MAVREDEAEAAGAVDPVVLLGTDEVKYSIARGLEEAQEHDVVEMAHRIEVPEPDRPCA